MIAQKTKKESVQILVQRTRILLSAQRPHRPEFPAEKLPDKKTAHQKRCQRPAQLQSVKLADEDNQRYRCMNGHKPAHRKFLQPAAQITKRQIHNNGGQAGVKYPPLQAQHVAEKKRIVGKQIHLGFVLNSIQSTPFFSNCRVFSSKPPGWGK